jgi:hypothetical protein
MTRVGRLLALNACAAHPTVGPAGERSEMGATGNAWVELEECIEPRIVAPPLSHYATESLGGFAVLWHPELEDALRAKVAVALRQDIAQLARVAPTAALDRLSGTRVVVDPEFVDAEGTRKRGLATHRSAAWLEAHGLDGAREGVVEIYNANDYLRFRAGPQPMVLMHELTHVLALHADRPTMAAVSEAYARAAAGGSYDSAAHGKGDGREGKAYAMKNEGEYAAELAEAYLGLNDWFPYDRSELRGFDPTGCAAVARLWLVVEPDC